jgi:hypothetical protein
MKLFQRVHLSYANVVATLALFLALTGGATAVAISLNKGSVTTKSIRKGAVTAPKLGRLVIRSQVNTVGSAQVSCAQGERVLGGGGTSSGGGLSASLPSPSTENGWAATGVGTVTAYALCLKKK